MTSHSSRIRLLRAANRPLLAILLWAALGQESACVADVLELKTGGQVLGTLVDAGPRKATHYVIETETGGRLTIAKAEVASAREQTEAEAEYARRARVSPDTVEAHWDMVQWCRDNQLKDDAERHVQRIIQLDPDHQEARTSLGYRNFNGQWLTREGLMASRGMVMYRGRYRTAQEIELLERNKKVKLSKAEWRERIKRWHRRLRDRDPERAFEARQHLLAIRDPMAAEALVDSIKDEKNEEARLLLIEVASQIEHQATVDALIQLSLRDSRDEVRIQSLEYLIKSGRAGLAIPYIRALRENDNVIINRAAAALQLIGDPAAISPLIAALVTEHTKVTGGGRSGNHAYTFSPDGSGFSFGGSKPKVRKQRLRNPDVLSALVALAGGESFQYDQDRWRNWLAARATMHVVDLRRDE